MKTISLFNHNNKLENNVFVHISAAPSKPILESELPIRVHINETVKTEFSAQEMMAGSKMIEAKSFDAEMIDFKRCGLSELSSLFTYMSHGIDREQFIKEYSNLNQVAIYIYKKL